MDALNPKTAIFFLAFLPQFVDPAAGAVAGQTLVLGLCFVALATLSDGGYALVAGAAAERLRRSARARIAAGPRERRGVRRARRAHRAVARLIAGRSGESPMARGGGIARAS